MTPNEVSAPVPASNLPDLRAPILTFDVVVEALASGVIPFIPFANGTNFDIRELIQNTTEL